MVVLAARENRILVVIERVLAVRTAPKNVRALNWPGASAAHDCTARSRRVWSLEFREACLKIGRVAQANENWRNALERDRTTISERTEALQAQTGLENLVAHEWQPAFRAEPPWLTIRSHLSARL